MPPIVLNMLMKCSKYCAIVGLNTPQAFPKCFFGFFGSDVLFEFFDAEVTVMVKFGESLFDP